MGDIGDTSANFAGRRVQLRIERRLLDAKDLEIQRDEVLQEVEKLKEELKLYEK